MRSSKHVFALSGCLTVQKRWVPRKMHFLYELSKRRLQNSFRKKKKVVYLSLTHARTCQDGTDIIKTTLFFHWCTSEIKIGPLCPNTDTINWKISCRLFLLPALWIADDPQALQIPWDCMVLPAVREAPFTTTASLACFTFRSIGTKTSYRGTEYTISAEGI